MTPDERRNEVITIEQRAGEAVRILSHYLNERVLSERDCELLNWTNEHISAVLLHGHFNKKYQLTGTERPFFFNKKVMYLFGRSIPVLWTLDSICRRILLPLATDDIVYITIDYLEEIGRMCRISVRDHVLPREGS
ncbi:MAG: hypothetical protein WAW33_00355 [Minisyncoccia bacterium]